MLFSEYTCFFREIALKVELLVSMSPSADKIHPLLYLRLLETTSLIMEWRV